MVLVEVFQAKKENAYTEYVSIPMRINFWTFNGERAKSQLATNWIIGLLKDWCCFRGSSLVSVIDALEIQQWQQTLQPW